MKIALIEDEEIATKRLKQLLVEFDKRLEVVAILESIHSAVNWFNANPHPDLIFLDIQLADGISFDIFDQVEINSPIIFITAYDEYAIKAFQLNSIDYLLKPVDYEELEKAMNKFEKMKDALNKGTGNETSAYTIEAIRKILNTKEDSFKERFIVKLGEHIYPVNSSEVIFFSSKGGLNYLYTKKRKFLIDYSLDKIEKMVDPRYFFRVSRNHIIRINAIKELIRYSTSRFKIKIFFETDEDIMVSRDRVAEFKRWLDK